MGADAGVTGGGLKNSTIAHNTLYGSTNAALSIVYESAQAGNLIANNIIWQAQNNLTAIDNPAGLKFQNNLWKVAPPAAFRGPGDKYGDPKFTSTPGYTPESFRPSINSPAANTGANIGVTDDFFTSPRGPAFDLGAIQFATGVTSSTLDLSDGTATEVLLTTTASPIATQVELTSSLPPTAQSTGTSVPSTPILVEPTATYTSVPVQPSPTAQQPQPSQETKYDNQHSAFVYSAGWTDEVSPYAIDGSFARTSTNGSSVTFQFTGQSFTIIYKGGPSYRKMDVYIDDVLVATIDERHDASTYKARWDYPNQLSPGQHTLKLIFVTTGSTTNGSLDAVLVR